MKVIEKVAVMLLLSELPLIAPALEFFFARVDRLTGHIYGQQQLNHFRYRQSYNNLLAYI